MQYERVVLERCYARALLGGTGAAAVAAAMSPGYAAAFTNMAYDGCMLHADIPWTAVNAFLRLDAPLGHGLVGCCEVIGTPHPKGAGAVHPGSELVDVCPHGGNASPGHAQRSRRHGGHLKILPYAVAMGCAEARQKRFYKVLLV